MLSKRRTIFSWLKSIPISLNNIANPKPITAIPMPIKNDNALFATFLAPLSSKKYSRFSKWIQILITKQGSTLKNTPSETNIEILERKIILALLGLADTKTLAIIRKKKSNNNPKYKKTFTNGFLIRFKRLVKNNKSNAKYKNTMRNCAKNDAVVLPKTSGKKADLATTIHGSKTNKTHLSTLI